MQAQRRREDRYVDDQSRALEEERNFHTHKRDAQRPDKSSKSKKLPNISLVLNDLGRATEKPGQDLP